MTLQIDPAGRPAPYTRSSPLRRKAAGFVLPGDDGAASAEAPDAPAQAAAPAALGLAAIPAPAAQDSDTPAAQHCGEMLQAMAGLQLALLEGSGEAARRALADLARTRPDAADPRLAAVLDAVAVRAAVELARQE